MLLWFHKFQHLFFHHKINYNRIICFIFIKAHHIVTDRMIYDDLHFQLTKFNIFVTYTLEFTMIELNRFLAHETLSIKFNIMWSLKDVVAADYKHHIICTPNKLVNDLVLHFVMAYCIGKSCVISCSISITKKKVNS